MIRGVDMKKKTIDVLIKLGMNANARGFMYIVDAMNLLVQDEELLYMTCNLYREIALLHKGASESSVERCIRYSFQNVCTKGNLKMVEKWLTVTGVQTNSNLLSILYFRLKEALDEDGIKASAATEF